MQDARSYRLTHVLAVAASLALLLSFPSAALAFGEEPLYSGASEPARGQSEAEPAGSNSGVSGDGAGQGVSSGKDSNADAQENTPGSKIPDEEQGSHEDDDFDTPDVPVGLVEADGVLRYYENDGRLFTGGLKAIETDGVTSYYYFQDDGTALTGSLKAVDNNGVRSYYYFQDDGKAFTGGYKPLSIEGKRTYYYFTADGTAYTQGYLKFNQGGKDYCFFFQPDGTAFTGGYKEITLDGEQRYFYFLANGQAFNTGYKTVMIDGKKYYFFFGSDCRAITSSLQSVDLAVRTAYFYLQENGRAYTDGYKELGQGNDKHYYYFLRNGQAFTTGYKVVKRDDGSQDYYYFQKDGTAYTAGRKQVSFGNTSFYYSFGSDGKAAVSSLAETDGVTYYYGASGRAEQGWVSLEDTWYYAGTDGEILSNTVVEGYRLSSDGTCPTKARIVKLVRGLINDSMSDQEKICAVFDWLVGNDMTYIRTYEHAQAGWTWYDGWVDDFAVQLIDNNGGNCFRYASLLGFMVREATGLDVRIVTGKTPAAAGGRTAHGWIEVRQDGNWYIYDAEMVKFTRTYLRSHGYKVLHGTGWDYYPSEYTNIF